MQVIVSQRNLGTFEYSYHQNYAKKLTQGGTFASTHVIVDRQSDRDEREYGVAI